MAVAFALPCFTTAAWLWTVWRRPMAIEGGRWVRVGMGVFVLEFILLGTGLYLATLGAGAESLGARVGASLGVLGVYGLFAAAIALSFQSPMLFGSFLWVVAGRFVALTVGISAAENDLLVAHAVLGALLYFAMVVASVFVPFPRLGITAAVAAATRQPHASGLWVDEPHRAIGAATVYFFLLGVLELALMTWVDPGAFPGT